MSELREPEEQSWLKNREVPSSVENVVGKGVCVVPCTVVRLWAAAPSLGHRVLRGVGALPGQFPAELSAVHSVGSGCSGLQRLWFLSSGAVPVTTQ